MQFTFTVQVSMKKKMCFVKIVSFSGILMVQNLSLIYALSFKSKTDILIKILLSVQFKHKTNES